ncbi:hypothetical protein GCM10020221_25270 [Streptomyces thioluteus]|uniref:VOC domain-containing protein n=1 Tax=Streptomyces thioluteus TaxID=66431 RepID=A0ABN3WWT5_STRTU
MRRRGHMVELARETVGGSFLGQRVAVLGATFKPDSDDVRDSPALNVAGQIHLQGGQVTVYDPKGMENARRVFPTLAYADSALEACRGARVVLHLTEWAEFRSLDPRALRDVVAEPHLLDGRNALDAAVWRAAGWSVPGDGPPAGVAPGHRVAGARARAQAGGMSEVRNGYAPGTPCWVDLMAPDQRAALDFYRDLFGWQGEPGPPETGGYAVCTLNGRAVAGIGPAMARDGQPAPPTVWTTYLAVADAEASAGAVAAHGGKVVMPAMEVLTFGRMAIVSDPSDAVFGLWEPRDFTGCEVVNEPGALTWNELATPDVDGRPDLLPGGAGHRGRAVPRGARLPRPHGGRAARGRDAGARPAPAGDTAALADVLRRGRRRHHGGRARPGRGVGPAAALRHGDGPDRAVVSDPQGGVFAVFEEAVREAA